MRIQQFLIAALLFAASVVSAKADTFGFTFMQGNGGGLQITISGTLTAVANGTPGQFTITGASGTEIFAAGDSTTNNVTGVLSPGAAGAGDNILYTSGLVPYLDTSGVTVTTDGTGADGSGGVNIAYNTFQGTYLSNYEFPTSDDSFTLTDVPEPASLTMVVGFLGLGLALRKVDGRS